MRCWVRRFISLFHFVVLSFNRGHLGPKAKKEREKKLSAISSALTHKLLDPHFLVHQRLQPTYGYVATIHIGVVSNLLPSVNTSVGR